jgi:peroxiredoxin
VYPRLQELGYKLIGVSPDSPEQNAAFAEDIGLEFPLMSDNELAWTRRFGIVFETEKRGRLPVPAVYLVDGEGTVQFHYVHPNYRVRLDPDLLVVAAEVGVRSGTK